MNPGEPSYVDLKGTHDIKFVIFPDLGGRLCIYRRRWVMDVERVQFERMGISDDLKVLLGDL
jgi:hypothetical protein